MAQGICALFYINVPFINEALLIAALIMFAGILLVVISQYKRAGYAGIRIKNSSLNQINLT